MNLTEDCSYAKITNGNQVKRVVADTIRKFVYEESPGFTGQDAG